MSSSSSNKQVVGGVVGSNSNDINHDTAIDSLDELGIEEKKESTLAMDTPSHKGAVLLSAETEATKISKLVDSPSAAAKESTAELPSTPSNNVDVKPESEQVPQQDTPTVTPETGKAAGEQETTQTNPLVTTPTGETASAMSNTKQSDTGDDQKEDVAAKEASALQAQPQAAASRKSSRSKHRHRTYSEDDDDSSNDDSSYFADPSNLPSPKSGRHFSHSSITSATGGGSITQASGYHRESDASLSLSDDSDDAAHHHGRQPLPVVGAGGVPELYPHPLTRMHSVSSLVSTSSQNTSESDPTVQEELRDVAGRRPLRHRSTGSTPSGRRSPVLGEHSLSGRPNEPYFQSPMNPQPSPPTILSSRQHRQSFNYPHPQPHLMTAEELAMWTAAGNVPTLPFPTVQAFQGPLDSKQSPGVSREGNSFYTYSEESEGHNLHAAFSASTAGHVSRSEKANDNRTRSGFTNSSPYEGADDGGSRAYEAARGGLQGMKNKKTKDAKDSEEHDDMKGFTVYWQRWIMLMYMSILNLLSDWTCYSVAPIAVLTEEAFGHINAEQLVVVFLGANAVASACEPMLLSRLGLRRTVLFGSLLLMIGSIVKSGGMPPIIEANLEKGQGEWRVYVGFFLVGLSQPLYQCTPALLSASWFPERERTMATGVALNANQVGIGFAFIFGTLLVENSDDIPSYFGLLSIVSTLTFLGVLIQFDDAPPTPPSDTARVIRGTMDAGLPSVRDIFESVRNLGGSSGFSGSGGRPTSASRESIASSAPSADREAQKSKNSRSSGGKRESGSRRSSRSSRKGQTGSATTHSSSSGRRTSGSGNTRRRTTSRLQHPESAGDTGGFHALAPAPSPARWGPVAPGKGIPVTSNVSSRGVTVPAPSPMMPGGVAGAPSQEGGDGESTNQEGSVSTQQDDPSAISEQQPVNPFVAPGPFIQYSPGQGSPYDPNQTFPQGEGNPLNPSTYAQQQTYTGTPYGYPVNYQGYQQYPQPVWDPRYQQYVYFAPPMALPQYQVPHPYYQSYQNPLPRPYLNRYESADSVLPLPADNIDVGAEPVLTITPHHLDIDIRDDQVLLSTRACLSRPGFIHALVAFTVSGIVINTLSTFMDYLVRLNGAGREYTGIVGGSFQFVIMISSLIVGQFTDRTRAYYSVTVGMLVLGAFGLAECGVNLDSDRGTELRWSLVIVAALVGPLQPVSTELGVDVVYPLSENTVLVIQQLFSNLLSALFIPCFKAFRDFGVRTSGVDNEYASEQPQYTFSFYVLIVLHAAATVFFATFNGRYLRYEHELEKKATQERKKAAKLTSRMHDAAGQTPEQQPLIPPIV